MLEATPPQATAAGAEILKAIRKEVPVFLLPPPAAKAAVAAARVAQAKFAKSVAQDAKKAVQLATHKQVAKTTLDAARKAGASPAQAAHVARKAVASVAHDVARKAGAAPAEARKAAHNAVADVVRDAARKAGLKGGDVEKAARSAVADVAASAAKAAGVSRKDAEKLVKSAVSDVAKKGVSDLGKQLGASEAASLFKETLKKSGLPNIPIPPLSSLKDLSPQGIVNTAYGVAATYLDRELQSATGIPGLHMPRKVSWDELEKTVDGLIPDNAKEALEMALSYSIQAGANAVATLLAGATIGSAIPGLGTVIGIAAAVGVSAIRDAVREAAKQPYQKALEKDCGGRDAANRHGLRNLKGKGCIGEIIDRPPLDLLPEIARRQAILEAAIAPNKPCGKGEIFNCLWQLYALAENVYPMVKDAPDVLGLPETERLIKLYEKTPKSWVSKSGRTSKGSAADYIYLGTQRSVNRLGGQTSEQNSGMLTRLRSRRDYLKGLVAEWGSMGKLPGGVSSVRFNLVTELNNAAVQFQNNPKSSTAKSWLKTVARAYSQMDKAEKAQQASMAKDYKKNLSQEEQRLQKLARDPKARAEDERDQVFWLCEEQGQAGVACSNLRARQHYDAMIKKYGSRAKYGSAKLTAADASKDQWALKAMQQQLKASPRV